jgi:hypothetical protein
MRGSCLCGRVSFELDLPFLTFVNCHCSRCRKATGTAHAVNGTVAPDALRWLSGEDSITRYDLPTAKSFATSFCKECGSPVPHLTRGGSRWIVPAGSLDEPLSAHPERHVQWKSRANWYQHGGQLPISE